MRVALSRGLRRTLLTLAWRCVLCYDESISPLRKESNMRLDGRSTELTVTIFND